ncbi:MAG: hypothetical protein RSB80_08965, partial [Anaerovoracaceae bacterium]
KNGSNQPKSMERNIAEEEDGWINRHNMEKKIMSNKRKLSFQRYIYLIACHTTVYVMSCQWNLF